MKKLMLLIIIFINGVALAFSQQFSMLGSGLNQQVRSLFYDSIENVLYVGGGFQSSGSLQINSLGRWNGIAWDSVDNHIGNIVNTITKYDSSIFCGGDMGYQFDTFSINYNLFKLVADSPYLFGGGTESSGFIYELIGDTNLWVFGRFDSIGGISASNVARYDGANWHSFPTLDNQGFITCATFYNGDLYVGGNFNSPLGLGMKDIARWDGSQWQSVGGGLSGTLTFVNDMKVWNGELYIGGYFNTSSGDPGNNIVKWNGANWMNPGGGLGILSASVWALSEYNGNLWAGGVFGSNNGCPFNVLAYWDGTQWHGSGLNILGGILTLETWGNDLYAAGGSLMVNGTNVNRIFKYTQTTGIDEFKHQNRSYSIGPNPANNLLLILFDQNVSEDYLLSIYNVVGTMIKQVVVSAYTNITEIDVSDLSQGSYLIKTVDIQNESRDLVKRFIILR